MTSLAAGIDHLMGDPELPDVPVVRMVEPSLTAGVAEYILLHVMRHHKDQRRFEEQQKARVWAEYFAPPAGHPFWSHSKITVTPHSAGDPFPETAAQAVAQNIMRFRNGEPLPNIARREDGY